VLAVQNDTYKHGKHKYPQALADYFIWAFCFGLSFWLFSMRYFTFWLKPCSFQLEGVAITVAYYAAWTASMYAF